MRALTIESCDSVSLSHSPFWIHPTCYTYTRIGERIEGDRRDGKANPLYCLPFSSPIPTLYDLIVVIIRRGHCTGRGPIVYLSGSILGYGQHFRLILGYNRKITQPRFYPIKTFSYVFFLSFFYWRRLHSSEYRPID